MEQEQINQIKSTISSYKRELRESDYKVLKYIEGQLDIKEYQVIKLHRQDLRDKINELEGKLK